MMLKTNEGRVFPRDERGAGALGESYGEDFFSYAMGFAKRQAWVLLVAGLVGTGVGTVFLLKAKPNYTATATLIGGSGSAHSASFSTKGSGAQQMITITFPRPPEQPTQ